MDVVRSGHTLVRFFLVSSYRKNWTFPEVQWLRLHTSTVVGVGLIPFQGTMIPHAEGLGQKKKKKSKAEQIAFPERLDVGFQGKRNV